MAWDGPGEGPWTGGSKSHRKGQGWVRAGFWGRRLGRQGLGDKQGVKAVAAGLGDGGSRVAAT